MAIAEIPVWSVYLLRCADDSLYTGIAADVHRRLREHSQGSRGAKYLQGRGPFELVFEHAIGNRGIASQIEYRIKQLSKDDKERLVSVPSEFREYLQLLAEGLQQNVHSA